MVRRAKKGGTPRNEGISTEVYENKDPEKYPRVSLQKSMINKLVTRIV